MNIEQIVRRLGIRRLYKGYYYLVYAISLLVEDEDCMLSLTKWLYPAVAEHFETNVCNVERNLRTVVGVCWRRGNRSLLSEMAGYPLLRQPTLSQFLDIVVTYIRDEEVA